MPRNQDSRPVERVKRLVKEALNGPARDWDKSVDDVLRRVCVDRDPHIDGKRDAPTQYPGGNPKFNERGPSRTEVRRNKVWAGGNPDFDERRSG